MIIREGRCLPLWSVKVSCDTSQIVRNDSFFLSFFLPLEEADNLFTSFRKELSF